MGTVDTTVGQFRKPTTFPPVRGPPRPSLAECGTCEGRNATHMQRRRWTILSTAAKHERRHHGDVRAARRQSGRTTRTDTRTRRRRRTGGVRWGWGALDVVATAGRRQFTNRPAWRREPHWCWSGHGTGVGPHARWEEPSDGGQWQGDAVGRPMRARGGGATLGWGVGRRGWGPFHPTHPPTGHPPARSVCLCRPVVPIRIEFEKVEENTTSRGRFFLPFSFSVFVLSAAALGRRCFVVAAALPRRRWHFCARQAAATARALGGRGRSFAYADLHTSHVK